MKTIEKLLSLLRYLHFFRNSWKKKEVRKVEGLQCGHTYDWFWARETEVSYYNKDLLLAGKDAIKEKVYLYIFVTSITNPDYMHMWRFVDWKRVWNHKINSCSEILTGIVKTSKENP